MKLIIFYFLINSSLSFAIAADEVTPCPFIVKTPQPSLDQLAEAASKLKDVITASSEIDTTKGSLSSDEKKCTDQNTKDLAPIVEWKKNDSGNYICYNLKANCLEPNAWEGKAGCVHLVSEEEEACTDQNKKGLAPVFEWKLGDSGKLFCNNLKDKCASPKEWDESNGCAEKQKDKCFFDETGQPLSPKERQECNGESKRQASLEEELYEEELPDTPRPLDDPIQSIIIPVARPYILDGVQ